MTVKGTSNVRIARIPVKILAASIWPRVTGSADKNAEILLVLSVYIWVTPIPQRPTMITIRTDGIPSPMENTGGFWVGDRVYVAGRVNGESMMCWPVIVSAVEGNTIGPCRAAVEMFRPRTWSHGQLQRQVREVIGDR